jgi:hypothetical protein
MTKVDLRLGLVAGFINFLGYQFQTWGLRFTTPSNNAFFNGGLRGYCAHYYLVDV